jgi:N-acetylmuramoyl-L-alanine amidase
MKLTDRPSPNFDSRRLGLDMLILHYTGMKNAGEALARLTSLESKVSAHYLIDEEGDVFRLVAEEKRAWHAGVSSWRGRADINSASIGIELVNPGHEWGYRPFPEKQMEALEELCRGILQRHKIPARHVLGHSDVAPGRKDDPGELFDWRRLAQAGIGLWPDFDAKIPPPQGGLAELRKNLIAFGYACPEPDVPDDSFVETVRAFQLHFRPSHCDGAPDEETQRRAAVLARDLT